MGWRAKLKSFKPFTENEAWFLFKLSAIGEAVGWTLLITGVIIRHFKLPGFDAAIQIAGQVHGLLFLFYLGVVLAGFNSLSWSFRRTLVALLASVPPYGSLIFEQWAVRDYRRFLDQANRRVVVRAVIRKSKTVLAMQPLDNADWQLLGGDIKAGETGEQAVSRVLTEITGVPPKVGALCLVADTSYRKEKRLELYFEIKNSAAYHALDFQEIIGRQPAIDDLKYMSPSQVDPQSLATSLRKPSTSSPIFTAG